jgi:LacI family transcriptional regulator
VAGSGRKRPTLAMVASASGVSLPTVSKVLNGRADVAADTRARVEDALREHEYVPQSTRRITQPGRLVDLVFDDFVSPYSTEVLRGVVDAGAETGVHVIVARFPAVPAAPLRPEDAWARSLVDTGRKGLIVVTSELSSAQISAFERAGLALVVIDPVNLPRSDVVSVGATNFSGGLTATRHLTDLGHRRIGFIGGPVASSCSQARLHGYRAALEDAGIAVDPTLIRHGTFGFDSGQEFGAELLALADPPTAIFAVSDPTAVGVLAAARSRGLRVPDDLSIVGFDDSFLTAWSAPGLTTIRQPLRDMGRVALRTLLRLIDGERLDSHHVELATALVVRGSTSHPAANPTNRGAP